MIPIAVFNQSFVTVDYEWAVSFTYGFLDPIGFWSAKYRDKRKFFTKLRAVVSFTLSTFVVMIPTVSYPTIVISHLKYIIIYKKRKDEFVYRIYINGSTGQLCI